MKYIKGLDTLRAFAVLVVLLGHWKSPENFGAIDSKLFNGLFPAPKFGVDLFFVLSGFLITSILLQANESGVSGPSIIRNFIIRRTLRIFPIYYLTLAVLLLINYPFLKEHLWWFLTYTSNVLCFRQISWNPFCHAWSLAVEEQFYLVWPWLIVFINPRYLKYVLWGAILTGMLTTFFFRMQPNPNPFAVLLMPACMHAFGLGGLYAWYCRHRDQDLKKRFVRVINILFPVALLFNFYWGFAPQGGHFNYYYRFADVLIAIWLIHHTIEARPGWVKDNIVENPVLMGIGRISYGIYLYHFAIPNIYRMVVARFFGNDSPAAAFLLDHTVAFSISLFFVFALSIASFEYIEKPFLRLKKLFEYQQMRWVLAKEAASEE